MNKVIIFSRWVVSMIAIIGLIAIIKALVGPDHVPLEFIIILVAATLVCFGVFILALVIKIRDPNIIVEFSDPISGLKWAVTSWNPEYGDQCINWHSGMYKQIKDEMFIPKIFTYDYDCASFSDERDFRVVVCVGTCIDP